MCLLLRSSAHRGPDLGPVLCAQGFTLGRGVLGTCGLCKGYSVLTYVGTIYHDLVGELKYVEKLYFRKFYVAFSG